MIHSLIHFCYDVFLYSFIPDDIHTVHTMRVIETSKTDLLASVSIEHDHSTFGCPTSYHNEKNPVAMIISLVRPLITKI
jgi:hypothetical protein